MHLVVGLLGSSEAAVRLPSLVGMSGAAGMTAVLGRRLAANSAVFLAPPVPGVTAGLLLVAIPQTTHYAQDSRPGRGRSAFPIPPRSSGCAISRWRARWPRRSP